MDSEDKDGLLADLKTALAPGAASVLEARRQTEEYKSQGKRGNKQRSIRPSKNNMTQRDTQQT